jgi:hypothetical protein
MWAEVLSPAPHFLHNGLSVKLIKWWCLRRVLCRVRNPATAQGCILLNYTNLTLVPRQGPEINSPTCRWELPRSCQSLRCWFPSQRLILFLKICLEATTPAPVPKTQRQSRSSRTLRQVHCHTPHAQWLNILPQHAEPRYHLTPPDINKSMGMFFWKPRISQCHQTIRLYTYVFLWCSMNFNVMYADQDSKYLGLNDCGVSLNGKAEPQSGGLPIDFCAFPRTSGTKL